MTTVQHERKLKQEWIDEYVKLRDEISADVRRLVIAARKVAFGEVSRETLKELDEASEAFAERIPWDDQPRSPSA
jgi:hypothetical protein